MNDDICRVPLVREFVSLSSLDSDTRSSTEVGQAHMMWCGLQVPGFGVEMALKNMEYSALDDSKVGRPVPPHDFYQHLDIELLTLMCHHVL